jgi:DNA end-binding protein Ku
MARVIWKGAIVFGLVNIPVDLYSGTRASDLDFDWLDKRDMAPVGYQRINKVSGKPVDADNIVTGYQYEEGRYVVLSDEDFRLANPKATQTVEILAFVKAGAIDPQFFDTPYRLVPGKRGEKGYALLRETLSRAGKLGVAQVVIRNKQHLAVVMPAGKLLLLETLRYGDEILEPSEFELPPVNLRSAGVTEKEIQLATRLVDDMTEEWRPAEYKDSYREDLLARIQEKIEAGKTEVLTEPSGPSEARGGAQIIDLMAALKKSVEGKAGRSKPAKRRGVHTVRKSKPPSRKRG